MGLFCSLSLASRGKERSQFASRRRAIHEMTTPIFWKQNNSSWKEVSRESINSASQRIVPVCCDRSALLKVLVLRVLGEQRHVNGLLPDRFPFSARRTEPVLKATTCDIYSTLWGRWSKHSLEYLTSLLSSLLSVYASFRNVCSAKAGSRKSHTLNAEYSKHWSVIWLRAVKGRIFYRKTAVWRFSSSVVLSKFVSVHR